TCRLTPPRFCHLKKSNKSPASSISPPKVVPGPSLSPRWRWGPPTAGFLGAPPPPASADPFGGYLQSAPDPFRSKDVLNLTTELERNKLANYACPVTSLAWSSNRRTTSLQPFDD